MCATKRFPYPIHLSAPFRRTAFHRFRPNPIAAIIAPRLPSYKSHSAQLKLTELRLVLKRPSEPTWFPHHAAAGNPGDKTTKCIPPQVEIFHLEGELPSVDIFDTVRSHFFGQGARLERLLIDA